MPIPYWYYKHGKSSLDFARDEGGGLKILLWSLPRAKSRGTNEGNLINVRFISTLN